MSHEEQEESNTALGLVKAFFAAKEHCKSGGLLHDGAAWTVTLSETWSFAQRAYGDGEPCDGDMAGESMNRASAQSGDMPAAQAL